MIVSGCDTPACLEADEELLDPVAHGVDHSVRGMLDLIVQFGRNPLGIAVGTELDADVVRVIDLVGENVLQLS